MFKMFVNNYQNNSFLDLKRAVGFLENNWQRAVFYEQSSIMKWFYVLECLQATSLQSPLNGTIS